MVERGPGDRQGRTTPGTIRAALARQRVRTIPKIPILTNLPPRPLSSPHPRPICPSDGSGRCKTILQRRAAPGSARQRQTGTDGPAACGGAAVPAPQAWDHVRSHAVPLHLPLPLAPAHVRSGAASLPLAPPGQPGPASADRSVLRSHRPLAGSRQSAAPGCLAPRPCHFPSP